MNLLFHMMQFCVNIVLLKTEKKHEYLIPIILQKMLNQWGRDGVCVTVSKFGHQWLIIRRFLESVCVCVCCARGSFCQPSCLCVSVRLLICVCFFWHKTYQTHSTCIQRGCVHLMCLARYCSLSYSVPFRHRQQQLCCRINVSLCDEKMMADIVHFFFSPCIILILIFFFFLFYLAPWCINNGSVWWAMKLKQIGVWNDHWQ